MSTYIIGDIQGCLDSLERLLESVAFSSEHDRLILVGDLINRGPRSLDTLRFVHSLGDAALTVLGNHDIHLLAVAAGLRRVRPGDTITEIIQAPDRDILLDWLSARPLFLEHEGWTIVHAGLLPCWSIDEARSLARETERVLASADGLRTALRTPFPESWSSTLITPVRVSMALAVFTRIRMCRGLAIPDFQWKQPPDGAPPGTFPWYAHPHPSWATTRICFGHWAALGYRTVPAGHALDSGCVWGRSLTALRLEDQRVFQLPSVER